MEDFDEYMQRYAKQKGVSIAKALDDKLPWYVGAITYGLTLEQIVEYGESHS